MRRSPAFAFLSPCMAVVYPAGGCVKTCLGEKVAKRKKTEPEELLAAIAEAVDDGFCPASALHSRLPKLGHRDLVRLYGQAVRRGLLLERRGPDGRVYLALTSEGWDALRSSPAFRPGR